MPTEVQKLEAEEAEEKLFDASDPKQVNEARKKEGRKKAKERNTLKTLMEYPNGRELMFNSVKCILSGTPLVPNDPYSTYYNLGQEARARIIFQEIVRVSPKEFALMIEENVEDL